MFSFLRNVPVQGVVESAADVIPRLMGDDLQALILYGEHVDAQPQSDSKKSKSPINLLVVLRVVDLASLNRLAEAYQGIRGHQSIAPMVLTADELNRSTDVFPVTFLDMKRRYRVLAGDDVLAQLSVQSSHLRLRCEQELKNLALRMQSNYLARSEKSTGMRDAFQRNFTAFVRAIGASLLLLDKEWPMDPNDVLEAAADNFGLNRDSLHRISQAYEGCLNLEGDLLTSIYGALMSAVQYAALAIDQLPEQVTLVEIVDDSGGV